MCEDLALVGSEEEEQLWRDKTRSFILKTGSCLFLHGMFAGLKQGYQKAAGYIFMSHTDWECRCSK